MKKQLLLLLIIVFSAGLVNAQTGAANSGKKMTFQGSLFENGEPFTGNTTLSFSIQLDSSRSWSEVHEAVQVANGLYSVVLGKNNRLPVDLFAGSPERTVVVKVGNVTLGEVKLYEPFSGKPVLPMDMAGPNGNRSVMLSSEGANGNDGTFRLSNEFGGSRVTIFANKFDNAQDSTGTRIYTGAGGAWFGGANGSQSVFMSSNGTENSNGYLDLSDGTGTPLARMHLRESQSGFTRGEINLYNNADSRNAILRPDQLYFLGENSTYPAGWYGTINGTSGFSQQVGFDSLGGFTGAILSGFWDDNRPGIWLEDGEARMRAWLHQDHFNSGALSLEGFGTPNIGMGSKGWEQVNGADLPYFKMNGSEEVTWVDDKGTEDPSDDETGTSLPDLLWMDVQKWENGTEVGNITLRGTDGSEFTINSHGLNPNAQFNRIDMKDSLDRTSVVLSSRRAGGGLLYFPGSDGSTYNWIQNRVLPDGSAQGSSQVANIASDGSYVTGTGMSGGFFYIDSWANERFYTNVELGLTQEANKLPYLNLRGSEILNWFDDKGTADSTDDTSGTYLPDLISMRVTRQEDGSELGNFILRGTDGSEFGISSHGITQTIDYRSKEFVLENQADNRRVGNMLSNSNGGQLNIGGIIETSDSTSSQGGGISIGSKFWEGNPHLGYFHLRGTVNDANFNANMKFSLEAMKDDVAEEAEFKMFGSELDENAATKVVLRMNTIRNGQGQSASEITGLGSYTENFKIGAKVWETDGTELPYLSMKGTASAPYYNDGGTPEDSTDDDSGEYTKDLIWMDAQKWEDGSERGHISLNGTNGFYHNMTDWISEIKNELGDGTYSQQRSNVFRVKNDNDPYSSVFLTRGSNGNAFLQLASHDNGNSRGVLNIGSDNDGPYLVMAAADGYRRIGMIVNDTYGATLTLRGANDIDGSETDSLGNPIPMRPQLAQMRVEIDSASGDETGAIYVSNASGENTISLIGSTGNINITGSLAQNSDARLKKDVNTLEGALKNVSKMRGVSYHWKDDSRTSDKQIGVIAQEVEAVYPEFVSEDKDGIKSVNYPQMTAVLIEAVKELNAEITSLKETNATLKAEVSNAKQLEDRLLQIEKLLGVKTNDTANANK